MALGHGCVRVQLDSRHKMEASAFRLGTRMMAIGADQDTSKRPSPTIEATSEGLRDGEDYKEA